MDIALGTLAVTFFGGLLMFLAPCTLPMVPAFLASLVPGKREVHAPMPDLRELRIRTVLFTVGFTSVFVLFGMVTGFLGSFATSFKATLASIGGVLVLMFGLSILGVFKALPLGASVNFAQRFPLSRERRSTSFFLGTFFALGWSPCAGPVLASVLVYTSQFATALKGGVLLLAFSLGLAVPFIATGFLYSHIANRLVPYRWLAQVFTYAGGSILVVFGLLLIFGNTFMLTEVGFTVYQFLGLAPMCSFY